MKTLRFVLLIFLIAGLASTLSNCKSKSDDPAPSAAKKITDLLTSGAWQIQSVAVDGVTHNELFPNLKLTFSDTGFTSANGTPVWPSSGTWEFTDKAATAFTRNDDIVVAINEISDTRLVLSFTWARSSFGGRVKSISGKNEFTFTR